MINNMTKEEIKKLCDLLKTKILENEVKFKEKKFKDDEIISILLKELLLQERKAPSNILEYIDLENISFENQDITFIDFRNTNAIINPQTIHEKDLQNTKLIGDFEGKSFDDTYIAGTDFSNATNVHIDPQKIKYKKIINANVTGVDFDNHSFEGVEVDGTNIEDSINCELNKTKYYKYKKRILELTN